MRSRTQERLLRGGWVGGHVTEETCCMPGHLRRPAWLEGGEGRWGVMWGEASRVGRAHQALFRILACFKNNGNTVKPHWTFSMIWGKVYHLLCSWLCLQHLTQCWERQLDYFLKKIYSGDIIVGSQEVSKKITRKSCVPFIHFSPA